jgi:hypothetical protein
LNPFDAEIIDYALPLGALREHWYPQQTPLKEIQKKHFLSGRFRTITTEGRGHILLRGNDGGILGYIVPVE